MRYLLAGHGWPIGQFLIPDGTVIDTDVDDDWSRLAAGRIPPNAIPLDQSAYDEMAKHYPYWAIITRDNTIKRHADPGSKDFDPLVHHPQ